MNEDCAIIILNYMDYIQTQECVNNLLKIEVNCKIVIVDNASPNNSFEILSEKYELDDNIFIIKNKCNNGYSAGNNFGIKFVERIFPQLKYIVVMNPDVILLNKKTIYDNIKILEAHDEIAIITSIMCQDKKQDLYNTGWNIPSLKEIITSDEFLLSNIEKRKKQKKTFEEKNRLRYVECIHGSFFISKIEILRKINYLDENTFLYYEENILGAKIKKEGYNAVINLGDHYIHDHHYEKMDLSAAQKSAIRRKQSQHYFLKEYLKCGSVTLKTISALYCIYIYIELPILKFINKVRKGICNGKS